MKIIIAGVETYDEVLSDEETKYLVSGREVGAVLVIHMTVDGEEMSFKLKGDKSVKDSSPEEMQALIVASYQQVVSVVLQACGKQVRDCPGCGYPYVPEGGNVVTCSLKCAMDT